MLLNFYRILALSLIWGLIVSCGGPKPGHNDSDVKAREVILRDNLYQIRKAIDLYSADKGDLPQSLDDLVKAGYLRQIPEDPFTKRPDWKLITDENPNSTGKIGIINVHSSSPAKSTEGKAYNEW